jgi:hypothetical protein
MAVALRSFMYLDATVVGEFLAQLEGGVYSEEENRSRSAGGRGLGGEVGLGAGPAKASVKGSRGSSQEAETARTLQQTPESEFSRLVSWLEESGQMPYVEAVDDAWWEQMRRGAILEAGVVLSVSTLAKFTQLAEQVGPLLNLAESMGSTPLEPETAEAMRGLQLLGQVTEKMPVIAALAGSPKYKFIAPLSRQHLRVDSGELEGEATLLLKVQRKLQKTDRYTVFETIPGLSALPRAKRRELERDIKNSKDVPDAVIRAPAAVVTPIAIYR